MANAASTLVETVRKILAQGEYHAEGEAGPDDADPWSDPEQLPLAKQMFEAATGARCPPGFDDALLMPDEILLRWQDGDIAGELAIANPALALEHTLDESLHSNAVDGTRLGTLRVIDRVVDTAGPLYTCWRPDDPNAGQLYLFDLRELLPLDCRLDSYLAAAGSGRGVTFWQRLFASGKLTPDVAQVLEAGLDWLEHNAPNKGLADLRGRLSERT